MRAFLRRLVACAAMMGVFAGMAGACGDDELPATADEKAQLVIKAEGGVVHIGQAIEASLILLRDSRLETGGLSRSNCTSFKFKVKPDTGWHDPWADWYYSGIPQHASGEDSPQPSCAVSGGTATAIRFVDGHIVTPPPPPPPPQIGFTLTDWVQFDRPGKYTISVTYRAQSKKIDSAENWEEAEGDSFITLETDSIDIEVLPETAEAAQRAAAELAAFTTRVRQTDPAMRNSETVPFPMAIIHSQAEAMIPSLVRLYESGGWFHQSALMNSSSQKDVVLQMEERLRNPGESITADFVELLAFSKTRLQHPGLFGSRIQNQWTEQWVSDSKVRYASFLQNMTEYTAQLLLSIPMKDERAQGDCLKTVLHILAHWPLPNKAALRQEAIREAARLLPIMKKPPDLWEDEWQAIASPAMVPYLLQTFQSHSVFEEQHQRWLSQVAPVRAQRMMIGAMEQGDWTLARDWGRVIRPNAMLSHLVDDDVINVLTNYADGYDNSAEEWVLLKFGTRAAAGSARKILASQDCLGDPTLWAFLLRVEGSQAEQSLIRRYQKASARADCRTDADIYSIVDQIDSTQLRTWKPYWSPTLESIFVSQLGNADRFVAAEAADLLGVYGSKQVEDTLWAKLEAWHHSPPPPMSDLPNVERPNYLEEEIIGALLNGHGWTAHNHIDRLRALCVYACWEVELARSVEQIQVLRVGSTAFDPPTISTNGSPLFSLYTFSEWLERFPRGTRFAITVSPYFFSARSPADVQNEYPEIWKVLQEKHFEVVGPSRTFDAYGRCVREKNNASLAQSN